MNSISAVPAIVACMESNSDSDEDFVEESSEAFETSEGLPFSKSFSKLSSFIFIYFLILAGIVLSLQAFQDSIDYSVVEGNYSVYSAINDSLNIVLGIMPNMMIILGVVAVIGFIGFGFAIVK